MCFESNAQGARTGTTSEALGSGAVTSEMDNRRHPKPYGIRSKVTQFGGNVGPALDPKDTRLQVAVSLVDRTSAPLGMTPETKV